MKKLLLVVLCIMPRVTSSMAALEDANHSNDKKNRRYSVLFETPLFEDTESLTDQIDEQGLIEVKSDLEKRKKQTVLELGLTNFLLQTMRQISPAAKLTLEKRSSQLDWQASLDDILIQEVEKKVQKRERLISEQLDEVTLGLDELEEDFLGDEVRSNFLRLDLTRAKPWEATLPMNKLDRLVEIKKELRPQADSRFNSVITDSSKGRYPIQAYNA